MSCLLLSHPAQPQQHFTFDFSSVPYNASYSQADLGPRWAYMEVDSFKFPVPAQHTFVEPRLSATPIMDTMDIDMDIDLGLEVDHEAEATAMSSAAPTVEPAEASHVADAEIQPTKIHVRGVDEMTTDNIKQFANEHFSLEPPERIEWIDDTSANIVYRDADTARQALTSLSAYTEEEAASSSELHLRSAKSLSTHPESILQVRIATHSDKKKPRAHEASRFYLLHPEYDPRERMQDDSRGGRRGSRRGDSDGEYQRRRYDDREHRRRRDRDEGGGFDVSMYDDAPAAAENGAGRGREQHRDRNDRTKELFPEQRNRDRSASPKAAMDREPTRRFRERTQSPSLEASNVQDTARNSRTSSGRELFPNKLAASKLKKELFNQDMTISNHRRTDAWDAANDTADRFAKSLATPFVDGASDSKKALELFPEKKFANIRGAADQGNAIRGAGISIKGAASVRELFPNKYSENAGKELFSEKLEGRGGRRRKAEDMFA